MLELTSENALEYLRAKRWIGPEPARVEALSWGVSNLVLRITTPGRKFILKQSRPQLRTREAWFSDLDRVFREQEVMQFLRSLLPDRTVPEVLFSDRDNYVFAMSHAPDEAKVCSWQRNSRRGTARCETSTNEYTNRRGRFSLQLRGINMKRHIWILGVFWLAGTTLRADDPKPKPTPTKGDPRAAALLQEAAKTRYTWSPDVTALSGKIAWEKDGQAGLGTFRSVLRKRGGLTIPRSARIVTMDQH